LARETGDERYLTRARELADASTTSETIHVDGVLTEPCEQFGCDADAPSYKGIYVRNLGELNRALDDHPYSEYLVNQSSKAYDQNRTQDNEYGLRWAGPIQHISGATQQSAVDLLAAAQSIDDTPENASARHDEIEENLVRSAPDGGP
jgi:Glycosyl hydrolase family 76